MGKAKIEWTDQVWNPVSGCSKVSQGCKHGYAERHWARLSAPGQSYAGRKFTDVRCHTERLMEPTRCRKPRMVFVNSMSDLFHEDVPVQFLDRVLAMMAYCRQHTFQVLTKRPARMLEYLTSLPARVGMGKQYLVIDFDDPERMLSVFRGDRWPLSNVWLGVSVEDQAASDERIPLLLQTPAQCGS
jgi:protein gp37